ncbi:MAG TPA: glycosyltransferase [Acidobacteriaceae bacterium]|jgi:glycosyltransferase involved in cell wall biosynthesis|nr:glycosyltransferase [Acidobacteriaceae bacterium]
MTPKVSAVIPTYNRADKVRASIDSVLAQTVSDVEVVVVDDGSTDSTARVLREAYGDRIRYCYQKNQGVSAARNRGIAEAKGEWIAFLDSDDHWVNNKLEWQLKTLEQFAPGCAACYTDVAFYNHSETRTMLQLAEQSYRHDAQSGVNTEVLRLLVTPGGPGMVLCPSSFMARADIIRRAGGVNPRLRYQQDTEFMFRVALLTGFCYVNIPLVWFDRSPVEVRHMDQLVPGVPRTTAGVNAWDRLEFILQDSEVWLNGLLQLKDVPGPVQSLIREQLGSVHSGLANCYLVRGKYGKARAAAYRAVRLNMTRNFAAKFLMTWISPGLAARTVRQRESKRDAEFSV